MINDLKFENMNIDKNYLEKQAQFYKNQLLNDTIPFWFPIMRTRNFMIRNSENGLVICIVMERWRNLQKEIYLKVHFICQGRNGIAGNLWKNIKKVPLITRIIFRQFLTHSFLYT